MVTTIHLSRVKTTIVAPHCIQSLRFSWNLSWWTETEECFLVLSMLLSVNLSPSLCSHSFCCFSCSAFTHSHICILPTPPIPLPIFCLPPSFMFSIRFHESASACVCRVKSWWTTFRRTTFPRCTCLRSRARSSARPCKQTPRHSRHIWRSGQPEH